MSAVFGRLPGVELGVPDGFTGQSVDFHERSEAAEGVLENGRGESSRRADDEQARFVRPIRFSFHFRD